MTAERAFDVIVVGAGPGGSALAALLSHRGMRVLLLDRKPHAGGKMMPIERDGFDYEMFPLNGVPRHGSQIERLISELGLQDQVQTLYPDPIGRTYFELPTGEVRVSEISEKHADPLALARLLDLTPEEFETTAVQVANILAMGREQIEQVARVPAPDFLRHLGLLPIVRAYLAVSMCEGYFQTATDRLSAAAFVRAFQESAQLGGGRYYAGGIGQVFVAFSRVVERSGGRFLPRTRVDRIIVEEGRVTGVVGGGLVYRAPIVVSDVGLQPTVLKLVGRAHYKTDYVDFVTGLETNLSSAGFRWVLDAPVLDSPMNVSFAHDSLNSLAEFEGMERGVFPAHNYVYLGTTSHCPGMAPAGRQLVYACMSCLPDPSLNIAPYLQQVRRAVVTMYPDLLDHVDREETFGPRTVAATSRDQVVPGRGGEDYGVALTPEQYGDPRLDGRSPIVGLFYVGGDAGGFGLGTHQAVDSAANVARLIQGDLDGLRRRADWDRCGTPSAARGGSR